MFGNKCGGRYVSMQSWYAVLLTSFQDMKMRICLFAGVIILLIVISEFWKRFAGQEEVNLPILVVPIVVKSKQS